MCETHNLHPGGGSFWLTPYKLALDTETKAPEKISKKSGAKE